MSAIPAVTYTLEVRGGPNPAWSVRRFNLIEALSEPYTLWVDLLTDDHRLNPDELLGADAQFDVERGEIIRTVCGVIDRVDYVGVNIDRKLALRLHIVPAMSLLSSSIGCQIFQDQTVPEILKQVLTPALLAFKREVDLTGLSREPEVYPKRDYCVQFRESLFDFVVRLMQEAGITYLFRVAEGKERLVLIDQNPHEPNRLLVDVEIIDPDVSGMIPIISTQPELADRESFRWFDWCQPLRPNQVTVRRFNWKAFAPRQPLEATSSAADPSPLRRHYVYSRSRTIVDEQAGANPRSNFDGSSIDEVGLEAKRRFGLYHRQGQIGRGRSNVIGLTAGVRFTLDDRSLPLLDDLRFVVTRVTHQGEDPGVERSGSGQGALYDNTVECIPLARAFYPARRIPPPRVDGPQTATVTGRAGEEIETDKHGRIKVRFHWDESSAHDETSSCWIRVAQMWAGAGWGTLFLPRIGMEVLVEFLDGNPDRPLVTGCVYNNANPPPYSLPNDKTKSTIKSNSSRGGGGFNELRFEDAKGAEEVFIHAEKDLNEVVGNNESVSVGNDQSLSVGNDRSKDVKGHETRTIHKDRVTTVEGSDSLHIKGSLNMVVDGGGNQGKASDPPAPGAGVAVTGAYNMSATQKLTLTVGNSKVTMDTSSIVVEASASITLKVGGSEVKLVPAQLDAKSATVIVAGGSGGASVLKLDGAADLKGGSQVRAHQGASEVKLNGDALVKGAVATVEATGIAELKGAPAKVTGGDVEVNGGTIDVTATGPCNVTGSIINLNG